MAEQQKWCMRQLRMMLFCCYLIDNLEKGCRRTTLRMMPDSTVTMKCRLDNKKSPFLRKGLILKVFVASNSKLLHPATVLENKYAI